MANYVNLISFRLPVSSAGDWLLRTAKKADDAAFAIIKNNSVLVDGSWLVKPAALTKLIEAGYTLVIDGVTCKYSSKILERVIQNAWSHYWAEYVENSATLAELIKQEEATVSSGARALADKTAKEFFAAMTDAEKALPGSDLLAPPNGGVVIGKDHIALYGWKEVRHEDFIMELKMCVVKTDALAALAETYTQALTAFCEQSHKRDSLNREIFKLRKGILISNEIRAQKRA